MNLNLPSWTRTVFPLIVGYVLTYLLSHYATLDVLLARAGAFGITEDAIKVALVAILAWAYHGLAVKLGARWPWIEKLMLLSTLVPVYVVAVVHRKKLGAVTTPHDTRTLDGTKYMDLAVLVANMPAGSLIGKFRLFLNWLMLGNDSVGDCVVAGILHAIMWASNFGGKTIKFSTAFAVKLYSLWTGYVPGDPNTDQGTDPDVAMKAWAAKGITRPDGTVDKIAAWFYVPIGNFAALRATIWLFGSAGICFNLPASAQDQFPSRKWTVVPGSPTEGGHYVTAVDDDGKAWTSIITWARTVKVAWAFMIAKSTRWYGYVTEDQLVDGKDRNGFDLADLLKDVAVVKAIKK
jgi:hypothetical protein